MKTIFFKTILTLIILVYGVVLIVLDVIALVAAIITLMFLLAKNVWKEKWSHDKWPGKTDLKDLLENPIELYNHLVN